MHHNRQLRRGVIKPSFNCSGNLHVGTMEVDSATFVGIERSSLDACLSDRRTFSFETFPMSINLGSSGDSVGGSEVKDVRGVA